MFPSHSNGGANEQDEPKIEIRTDEIEDATLLDMVEGAARPMDIDFGPKGFDNNLILFILARALSVAVEQHGAHVAPPATGCKRPALQDRSHAPSALPGNGCKSNKHPSHIDSALKSVSSNQSQLVNIARGSCNIKMANIGIK